MIIKAALGQRGHWFERRDTAKRPPGRARQRKGTRWLHHEGMYAKRAVGTVEPDYFSLVFLRFEATKICAKGNNSDRFELALRRMGGDGLDTGPADHIADAREIRTRETGMTIYVVCCQAHARTVFRQPARSNLVCQTVKCENRNVNSIPPTGRTLIDKTARAYAAGLLSERLPRSDFEATADPVVRIPERGICFHTLTPTTISKNKYWSRRDIREPHSRSLEDNLDRLDRGLTTTLHTLSGVTARNNLPPY